MPHDIIDNRQERLVDHIRRILPGSQAARFAVGYFFLSGLESVADQLDNVGELRLLIGNTSSRETIEQIAEGYRRLEQVQRAAEALAYPRSVDMEQAARETAVHVGQAAALLEQSDDAERLVGALVRLIEQGRLRVRVYTQGRLHAKAYIFDYGPVYDAAGRRIPREEAGVAIVGSSNFTLAGVTSNSELNVLVHGNANHAELGAWFERLWDEAQDFESCLMQELRQSWPLAAVTPYEVYLKTLYELTREQLAGAAEFLWQDDITAVLAEFQLQAVRQAVQIVRRYKGCFIADVVGLGKSYIGAAIVKHFERHDRARPLIVCPAPLVEMWEHYNEAYQLNARVLSMGMLHEDEQYGPEWMLYDERYRYRDFVLVDESHNFRHTDNQRYKVLQSFLAAEERRCVLLTATPRNKSAWDIYNQLRLFHQQDVTDVPVDPPHLHDYFKQVEEGQRRLPALLSHLLIRRTRSHVLRWYGYDAETGQRVDPDHFNPYREGERRAYVLVGGRKQFFPQRRLQTIDYSIEATYGGLYEQLRRRLAEEETQVPGTLQVPGTSETLTFARYGLWHYVDRRKRDRPPYADLQRAGANLRGLMRVMLFKRFESSVHAFRETVRRLLRIHRHFLAALEQGIVPAGEEAQQLLYESDQDEEQLLLDALRAASGRYAADDFDLAALRRDVAHDIGVLDEMLRVVEPITPAQDAKLQTLRDWLARPPLDAGKVLIFTQYADTAQYLYDNLANQAPVTSEVTGASREVEVIYSREKSKAEVVGRFAPLANPEQGLPPGAAEIDVLVATDVLSEGLNLQDCGRLVNYDLHWNPVRLIQRLGRIDRIGSQHDEVWAYNFMPEKELERHLGLHEKLSRRIQEIHETIGEDAAILDPGEQLNPEAMYAIYSQGDVSRYEEDDEDTFVDLHEAEEIVRQLREDQPAFYERIANLRDGVRCGRRADQAGTVVLCRAGRYRQLFWVDEAGAVVSRDVPRILNLLKCDPDTPAAPLPAGYNGRVTAVKEQFVREVEARQAEREHTLSLTKAQQYVQRELQFLYGQVGDEDVRRQIAALESALLRSRPREVVERELRRVHREQLSGMTLLNGLAQVYQLYGLETGRSKEREVEEGNDSLPRIVCSEGIEENRNDTGH